MIELIFLISANNGKAELANVETGGIRGQKG